MTSVHDIPPEILASSFEMAIFTWDISIIVPISLVCSSWHDIVEHTPRLWGIILLKRRMNAKMLARLRAQLEKAKEAPLSIVCGQSGKIHPAAKQLALLSHNWVMVETNTDFISTVRWSTLRHSLQELKLSRLGNEDGNLLTKTFFDDDESEKTRILGKIQFLSTVSIPPPLLYGLLRRNPHIQHFCIDRGSSNTYRPSDHSTFTFRHRHDNQDIQDTWSYLQLLPRAISIELNDLKHFFSAGSGEPPPPISLPKLRHLSLRNVLYPSFVLSNIAAPHLQTLVIDGKMPFWKRYAVIDIDIDYDKQSLAPFLTQWSAPGFLPEHLHTLELRACMDTNDVPYLIRWLERSNLVQLIIVDGSINAAASSEYIEKSDTTGEWNLFRALAKPRVVFDGSIRWLCPSLMILHVNDPDGDIDLRQLLPIAEARGRSSDQSEDNVLRKPSKLRRIETIVCSGISDDVTALKSLVDEVCCLCTSCGLMAGMVSMGVEDRG